MIDFKNKKLNIVRNLFLFAIIVSSGSCAENHTADSNRSNDSLTSQVLIKKELFPDFSDTTAGYKIVYNGQKLAVSKTKTNQILMELNVSLDTSNYQPFVDSRLINDSLIFVNVSSYRYYIINTIESRVVYTDTCCPEQLDLMNFASISPSDKYVLLESGLDFEYKVFHILDLATKQVVSFNCFESYDAPVEWVDGNTLSYYITPEYVPKSKKKNDAHLNVEGFLTIWVQNAIWKNGKSTLTNDFKEISCHE